jgi:hypothetical protein
LPRDKIIVTACPHKDRAIIAMVYLRTKVFDARYLSDGLIGLAENLRGAANWVCLPFCRAMQIHCGTGLELPWIFLYLILPPLPRQARWAPYRSSRAR